MASNIFTVLGTISVDMTAFNTNIANAIAQVNNLATAINSLNGISANVNVNQNGAGGGTLATTPATTTTANTNTNTNTNTGTNTTANAGTGTVVVQPGGNRETVMNGILANLGTQVINWAWGETREWLNDGWERNINEEVTQSKIKSLGGFSNVGAWTLLDSVNQFASDTPLDVENAWNVATRLLNYGVDPEELVDTMWMLGDITMGNGTNMLSVAKAYTETLGKNMLYSQEGYQFINAGVPIFDLLESYYATDGYSGPNKGLSAAEIKGFLNAPSGASVDVPAEDIKAALNAATSEGGRYYNAMNNMMNTQYGLDQRLGENMTNIAAGFVEPFQDIWSAKLLPVLVDFTSLIEDKLNPPKSEYSIIAEELKANGVLQSGATGTPLWQLLTGETTSQNSIIGRLMNGENVFDEWLYNFTGGMGYGLIPEAPADDYYETQPLPVESLRRRRHTDYTPYQMGAPGNVETLTFDDGQHLLPATAGFTSLMTQMQNIPQQITAAVASGFSGATVQVNVSTGTVRLNEGTIVGAITPLVDAQLGVQGSRAARG